MFPNQPTRRRFLASSAAALAAATLPAGRPPARPGAAFDPARPPRWRGFNLTPWFHLQWSHEPFVEEDFARLAELGFDFARLPLDYRIWLDPADPARPREDVLAGLDRAVEFGARHGVHVCLNFHRAPGWTVASPAEPRLVWDDPQALDLCSAHWSALARRYRAAPPLHLSFNLFNEPARVSAEAHAVVVRRLAADIRREDPDRPILVDGLDYGNVPAPGLDDLGVIHCTRGYRPFQLSHWNSYVEGSDAWPAPQWPASGVRSHLYGPSKPDLQTPLVLDGPVGGCALTVRVGTVSARARLVIRSGGRELASALFEPGPGDGPWVSSTFHPEWGIWSAVYDTTVGASLPAGARGVTLEVVEGDWLQFSALTLQAPGEPPAVLVPGATDWGQRPIPVRFDPSARPVFATGQDLGRAWLARECFGAWRALRDRGQGVFVGEFGAAAGVPAAACRPWLADQLAVWKEFGWGWAHWTWRGDWGLLDNARTDTRHEPWHGHRLDRPLLDLLRQA